MSVPVPGVDQVLRLPLHRIRPNPYQPRRTFSEQSLRELADSLREHGLLQPVTVRPCGDHFELIAGERRLRAAALAGLEEIPALVRDCTAQQMLEIALVENLQREDISPVETAHGFHRLAEEFLYSHGEIARRTGRSRASVANTLRLLRLPATILDLLDQGEISEGHARVLLMLPDHETQREAAAWIARNGVSVRELEEHVRRILAPDEAAPAGITPRPTPLDPHVAALREALAAHFGTKAEIAYRQGAGSITLHFYSDEDLERILELLGIA